MILLIAIIYIEGKYCDVIVLCSQSRHLKRTGNSDKLAVVVGTITDDVRLYDVPKIKVSERSTMSRETRVVGSRSWTILQCEYLVVDLIFVFRSQLFIKHLVFLYM